VKEAQSSSNRGPGACDAIVTIQDRQVGIIRLPENRADDFVDQFNRTYQELGLALQPITPSEKKNPRQQQG
jgi:hypothetical protein